MRASMFARLCGTGYALLGVLLLMGVAHQVSHPHPSADCPICVALPGGRRPGEATLPLEDFRQNRIDLRKSNVCERKAHSLAVAHATERGESKPIGHKSKASECPSPALRDRLDNTVASRAPPLRTLA